VISTSIFARESIQEGKISPSIGNNSWRRKIVPVRARERRVNGSMTHVLFASGHIFARNRRKSITVSFLSERELSLSLFLECGRAVPVTARVLSVPFLFIQRQPPAVLEPTYACSTFMDNCTPISLKGTLYPASPRRTGREDVSPDSGNNGRTNRTGAISKIPSNANRLPLDFTLPRRVRLARPSERRENLFTTTTHARASAN